MSSYMEDNASILAEARKQRKRIADCLSVDLPSVKEEFSGQIIDSWRQNGHYRGDAIHSLMSRVGGFPAGLARYLIAAYSASGEIVADPFCGKGTTIYEAALLGRRGIGGDVAPDAVIVSRAKCSNLRLEEIVNYIEGLKYGGAEVRDVSDNIRTFFHPETLKQIIAVRKRLLNDMNKGEKREVAIFVSALMLGILHGHSRTSLSLPCNQCFAMSPAYVKRYVADHGLKKPKRDVKKCLLERVLEFYPKSKLVGATEVHEASVLRCPRYIGRNKGKVSLVLTSPPYLNRQTYTKDSWLRLWFLGRDSKEVACSSAESGSIRVFLAFLEQALGACLQVIRKGGRVALVCGEAKVTVGGQRRIAKISELAIVALDRLGLPRGQIEIEALIRDRKKMVRGSYFAVHGGKSIDKDGKTHDRYGEEEILVLRRRR
ncbi:MAG: DNA methyltransferase [Pirellulales bacterium]